MKSAITNPKKTDLCTVSIRTTLGDEYTFPAMDRQALGKVLPQGSNKMPANTPTLAMVNASMSVLSVPLRIIETIYVDGETWWACPA